MIEQDEIVHDLGPFRNRWEDKEIFREVHLRPGLRLGRCRVAKGGGKAKQGEQ